MKLIIGLGNPGKEYEQTRHNVGFRAIDYYAKNKNLIFKEKFNGLYSEYFYENEKMILLKPITFMNLSGETVKKFIDFYKLSSEDILVIYDDVAFEVGNYKLKLDGSSNGHNGIKNIIKNIKTDNFKRIKIGISKNNYDLVDYVLGKFSAEDNLKLENIFIIIEKIINDFMKMDFEKLMSKYN